MYASGVFSYMSKTQSAIGVAGGNIFYLDKVRFSGSSGTCSLLHLKLRDIKGGNHSHSRGTIGNDLTGIIDGDCIGARVNLATTNGVFNVANGKNRSAEAYSSGANIQIRFSGSSGFTGSVLEWPALYSQPCHLRSHSLATAEAR